MALETIAGAARLWIVSNDQVIRCNSTTNSTLSSSVSRKAMSNPTAKLTPHVALSVIEMHSAGPLRTRCCDCIFRKGPKKTKKCRLSYWHVH